MESKSSGGGGRKKAKPKSNITGIAKLSQAQKLDRNGSTKAAEASKAAPGTTQSSSSSSGMNEWLFSCVIFHFLSPFSTHALTPHHPRPSWHASDTPDRQFTSLLDNVSRRFSRNTLEEQLGPMSSKSSGEGGEKRANSIGQAQRDSQAEARPKAWEKYFQWGFWDVRDLSWHYPVLKLIHLYEWMIIFMYNFPFLISIFNSWYHHSSTLLAPCGTQESEKTGKTPQKRKESTAALQRVCTICPGAHRSFFQSRYY